MDEITFGIEILPAGRRCSRLKRIFAEIVDAFSQRPVSFDREAAVASARFRGQRRRAGKPMSLADSQIAGIARSNNFVLATLNAGDFRDTDLATVEAR